MRVLRWWVCKAGEDGLLDDQDCRFASLKDQFFSFKLYYKLTIEYLSPIIQSASHENSKIVDIYQKKEK